MCPHVLVIKSGVIDVTRRFHGETRLLPQLFSICALFAWLISHQPAVLFSHNKSATSNQPAVLFSHNKPAPAISNQPNEQAVALDGSVRSVDSVQHVHVWSKAT
jgi:hypothetical protein